MFTPGRELNIRRYASVYSENAHISEMVKLPLVELLQQERESIDKEKAIYEQICGLESAWEEQAEHTIRLRKAQEYLKVPEVEHTSNQRKNGQYGWIEISNMVYKMRWRIDPITKRDWNANKEEIVGWKLDWSLYYNTPRNPDVSGNGWKIAGQSDKRFPDKAAMEKYLNGRIAAYAHLFTEISPPIPKGQEGRFSINGLLLPGYTVEVPEPTPQEVADSLLDLLDDEDLGLHEQPEEAEPPAVPPPQPSPAPPRKHPPKSAQAHKPKKSAPTR